MSLEDDYAPEIRLIAIEYMISELFARLHRASGATLAGFKASNDAFALAVSMAPIPSASPDLSALAGGELADRVRELLASAEEMAARLPE